MVGEDANGNIIGQHKSTGIGRPRFWERARYYGEEARLAAALDAAEAAERGPQLGRGVAMQTYAVFFLVAVAIGGVAYVFLYPILSGERKAERRVAAAARSEPVARPTRNAQKSRREQVEGTLKEIWRSGKERLNARRFRCAFRKPG